MHSCVFRIHRVAAKDTVVCDMVIPKGTSLNIPVYRIHRNPEYFPNPEVFDPERLLYNMFSKHKSSIWLWGFHCIKNRFVEMILNAPQNRLSWSFCKCWVTLLNWNSSATARQGQSHILPQIYWGNRLSTHSILSTFQFHLF